MRWAQAVIGEVLGLFMDDGSFALAIVIWLALAWLLLPRLDWPGAAKGAALFIGLAAILIESVVRRARTRK
jgi:hypothetical protein